ncbi:conserved hypothetical protein [Ricinus communis]|uniref:Uncharacterized protein n=1 Tax=Ricinus communis TaxID=3988 RepID=B9SJL2_RICCO|nr:conserved hypothetical protein [Ricinus communis]
MESQPSALERQRSIEAEPKTLFANDMNSAREAALEVIAKHSKEEALNIFLEGLRPVVAVKTDWEAASDDDDYDEYKANLTIKMGR